MLALEPQYMTILETLQAKRFVPLRSHQDFRAQSLGYPGRQVRHHG